MYPIKQIRACFNDDRVRVYQAFSDEIADAALIKQTFVPPFKRGRMTWIKPSFAWMMYRSGWARKPGQERVLAIDISHVGFQWALSHSCISYFDPAIYQDQEQWHQAKNLSCVRIQWDPDRDWQMRKLPWRTIQVGLEGLAVNKYVDEWIMKISDATELLRKIENLNHAKDNYIVSQLLPVERPYQVSPQIAKLIGCSE